MTRALATALAVLGLVAAACSGDGTRVVVAAGTTVVDSGLIDQVARAYEEANPGVSISVVAQPTRLALELGRDGVADVTLTHAPTQERALADEGGAVMVEHVFSSNFVLAGPSKYADVFGGYELPEVLRVVVASRIPFVSRADGSGTFDKEWDNWIEAGLDPRHEPWYLETGQGMGPTLLVADQREALVLVEIGALLAAQETISLIDLDIDSGGLDNPYTAMVMASSQDRSAAEAFVAWLVSLEGKAAIAEANRDLFGSVIYRPAGQS